MQTTVSRKQKRFDHQQARRLALIIGLVASLAIVAVALVLARSGEGAEQSHAVIVTTQPPFSETLDKGMLSSAAGPRERHEVLRREGQQAGSASQGERSEVVRREGLATATADPQQGLPTDGRFIP